MPTESLPRLTRSSMIIAIMPTRVSMRDEVRDRQDIRMREAAMSCSPYDRDMPDHHACSHALFEGQDKFAESSSVANVFKYYV